MTPRHRMLLAYIATLAAIGAAIVWWAQSDHSVRMGGPELPEGDDALLSRGEPKCHG